MSSHREDDGEPLNVTQEIIAGLVSRERRK